MQLLNPLGVEITPSTLDLAFLKKACGKVIDSSNDEVEINQASLYETIFVLLLVSHEQRMNLTPDNEQSANNAIEKGLCV